MRFDSAQDATAKDWQMVNRLGCEPWDGAVKRKLRRMIEVVVDWNTVFDLVLANLKGR